MFESQLNVKNLEDEISNKDMNLSPILKSIKELEKAAIKINDQRKEIEASKGWRTWKEYQMKVRDVNDRLMMVEHVFTDRDGLLGMTWRKHLVEKVHLNGKLKATAAYFSDTRVGGCSVNKHIRFCSSSSDEESGLSLQ
ncbi:probable glutamate carboxypeptidase LAMP1 [Arachis ipaensis]|uniref:probable glutamate carboxypeptidase LAMP1 n=1 Tax=Arachis ipaensis TaxID=130454 RepID=UPI000A2B3B11|nr:probable glutamate carboxypeptidase LAMP1 [Arachis ipaensis]